MTMRHLVCVVSVLTSACLFDKDMPAPEDDANVDHMKISTENAMYFTECGLQTPECLTESPLAGFWSCPGNDGYDFAIGEDGRVELLNHNGQHGIGCVTCDAAFELVSDADNIGKAWVNVGGRLSVSGDELSITWLMCGARELEACRADPDGERSEVCTRE